MINDRTRRGVNQIMTKHNATPVADDETTEAAAEILFSAKDLAAELNIDAKSFRRWLRSQTPDRANKGGRWVFDAESKEAWLNAYRSKDAAGTTPALPAEG